MKAPGIEFCGDIHEELSKRGKDYQIEAAELTPEERRYWLKEYAGQDIAGLDAIFHRATWPDGNTALFVEQKQYHALMVMLRLCHALITPPPEQSTPILFPPGLLKETANDKLVIAALIQFLLHPCEDRAEAVVRAILTSYPQQEKNHENLH